MVDHIFNEARSREILLDLRAEGQRMRLVLPSRQRSRTALIARAGAVAASIVAGGWVAAIQALAARAV